MKLMKNIFRLSVLTVLFSVGLIIYPLVIEAQTDFPEECSFFELDVLGQLYFVKDSQILKYSNDGVLLRTFSELYYGDISSLDVSDPMNILVYYKDVNKIVMLDNQLSIKNSAIDIDNLGFGQANLACLSYSNGFWIYDPISLSLIRFNNLLQQSENSGNLLNITGYQLNPVQLIERDNQLILRDKEYGIFVFDRYGNYLKRIPFINLNDLYIRSGVWQILKNDTSYFFNPTSMQVDTIPIKYKDVKEFRMNNKSVYYLLEENKFIRMKH